MKRLKNSITFSRIISKISICNNKNSIIDMCWKLRYLHDEITGKLILAELNVKNLKQENQRLKEMLKCQK